MALTCPKCSRVNPDLALYCHLDGVPLGDPSRRGQRGDPAGQRFANPFIFPSGQACHNFDQLALACLDNWQMALGLLQDGHFANFLGGLGRADLAMAARAAARPDRERGLSDLLYRLPAKALQPPRLSVSPPQVNLGVLRIGADSRWELHLTNQGMGLLHGTVSCEDNAWLALGDGTSRQKHF